MIAFWVAKKPLRKDPVTPELSDVPGTPIKSKTQTIGVYRRHRLHHRLTCDGKGRQRETGGHAYELGGGASWKESGWVLTNAKRTGCRAAKRPAPMLFLSSVMSRGRQAMTKSDGEQHRERESRDSIAAEGNKAARSPCLDPIGGGVVD